MREIVAKSDKVTTTSSKPIFLSHASKDKALADKLVDLLASGCAVNPNDVVCTSLEGKGIPAGVSNFIEFLRGQIQAPKLVILLLSENFFASQFCMCELGAVWGMDLPNFPLAVSAAERASLKAVLAVTQVAVIDEIASLDELRDRVRSELGREVPTATWTVKRGVFLSGLETTIKTLERPNLVPVRELQAAKDEFKAAMAEIAGRDMQLTKLRLQVADLERCKDREEVKAINEKYTGEQNQFDDLVRTAKEMLDKVRPVTVKAMFFVARGDNCTWNGVEEWREIQRAEELQEIEIFHESISHYKPCYEHIRVSNANITLHDLQMFLEDGKHMGFLMQMEEDYQFPINIQNREFWQSILKVYF